MTVLASDTFDRADGDVGANWVDPVIFSSSKYQITSNALAPTVLGGDTFAYYTAVSSPNDQYSQCKVSVSGTGGSGCGPGPGVRISGTTPSDIRAYRATADHAGTNNIDCYKIVDGTFTHLGTRTVSFSDGAVLYQEVVGTTIIIKMSGVQLGASYTDATLTTGAFGVSYSSTETSASVNDWEGGTPSAPVAATLLPSFADFKKEKLRQPDRVEA